MEDTLKNNEYIEEGCAEILSNGNVFYNPVQEFNRDLSILVINTYSKQVQSNNLIKSDGTKNDKNKLQEDEQNKKVIIKIIQYSYKIYLI